MGGCWERGGDFSGGVGVGGCSFHIKNKLKFKIFNDKKSLEAKIFFSDITKNSNWEICTINHMFKRKFWDKFTESLDKF